jgi:hypothetical protein
VRSLPKPTLPPDEIFRAAIRSMSRARDQAHHLVEVPNVAALGVLYDQTLSVTDAAALPRPKFTLARLTSEEMGRVYTYRLRRLESPIRHYYDDVLAAPDDDTCPYCGQRTAETVDHYVPQESFSALNVTPTNLVPACFDCNRLKGKYKPDANDPAILHPYFDNIDHVPWLGAQIRWPRTPSQSSPPKADFEVNRSAIETTLLADRVERHFTLLRLRRLFRSHAGQRLNALERRLPDVFRTSGATGVRHHLREEASSLLSYANNYWERRLYLALLADSHYCDVHFDRR